MELEINCKNIKLFSFVNKFLNSFNKPFVKYFITDCKITLHLVNYIKSITINLSDKYNFGTTLAYSKVEK